MAYRHKIWGSLERIQIEEMFFDACQKHPDAYRYLVSHSSTAISELGLCSADGFSDQKFEHWLEYRCASPSTMRVPKSRDDYNKHITNRWRHILQSYYHAIGRVVPNTSFPGARPNMSREYSGLMGDEQMGPPNLSRIARSYGGGLDIGGSGDKAEREIRLSRRERIALLKEHYDVCFICLKPLDIDDSQNHHTIPIGHSKKEFPELVPVHKWCHRLVYLLTPAQQMEIVSAIRTELTLLSMGITNYEPGLIGHGKWTIVRRGGLFVCKESSLGIQKDLFV